MPNKISACWPVGGVVDYTPTRFEMTVSFEIEPTSTSAPLRPGMVVAGKFALLRLLGEGTVGSVFEAEDMWLGRKVALKFLRPELAVRPDIRLRFQREARAAASIEHPNVVTVHELAQRTDGSFFIVQELLHGINLREHLRARGKLTALEVVEILVPVLGALLLTHQKGIVHRDIKPENIILSPSLSGDLVPRIIDFGIAKLIAPPGDPDAPRHAPPEARTTETGTLIGTPSYMSPEQAMGIEVDERTDVWAAGAMMFELLSGKGPFDAPSLVVMMMRIVSQAAPDLRSLVPEVPAQLAEIIHRALERDVSRRFASMEELLSALLDFGEGLDPSIRVRHARSIPAFDGARAEPARLEPVVEIASVKMPEPAAPSSTDLSIRASFADIESMDPEVARHALSADEALRVNALGDAVALAERAIELGQGSSLLRGRMRLVQAIARAWMGQYAQAGEAAMEAMERLPRGGTGWFAAVGHLAMISGHLGDRERLLSIVGELAEHAEQLGAAFAVAASRLSIFLLRSGAVPEATRALSWVESWPSWADAPVVRAWVRLSHAEFAVQRGDPAHYLEAVQEAVASFAEAGDARNACFQRANIGNAYMQLGEYERAEEVLRESLSVAEPLGLNFVAPVRANLGYVTALRGDVERGLEIETDALRLCVLQGYRRFEAVSRIYLALIRSRRGQFLFAEEQARQAVASSEDTPAVRALGLSVLSQTLIAMDQGDEALIAAREAMGLLESLGGVEEGESRIRLSLVEALMAVGDVSTAAEQLKVARERLLSQAETITDPGLRKSFLTRVPENAALLKDA